MTDGSRRRRLKDNGGRDRELRLNKILARINKDKDSVLQDIVRKYLMFKNLTVQNRIYL